MACPLTFNAYAADARVTGKPAVCDVIVDPSATLLSAGSSKR